MITHCVLLAAPGPESRGEGRPALQVHFREKTRYVHISSEKTPPVLISIDSAFVLYQKGKQLDDIIIVINIMTAIIWDLAVYQTLHSGCSSVIGPS